MNKTMIPPALMPAYLADGMRRAARAYRNCILLAIFTMGLFGLRDALVAPPAVLQQTLAIRACAIALGAGLLLRSRARPPAAEMYWGAYIFMNVMIASLAAIYALLPAGLLYNHTALFMVPMLGALFTPTLPPMLFALANCIASTQLALWWQPLGAVAKTSLNASLLIVAAFTVFLAIYSIRTRQAQFLLEQRLQDEATRDPMTGAYNRRHFWHCAGVEIVRSRRHHHALSTLLLDLDHFKAINDRYGHETGDRVICHTIRTLQAGLRDSDTLARIGGEEIAILLPHTDATAAAALAERLRTSIAAQALPLTGGDTLSWHACLGVATLRDSDSDLDTLLARADARLYQAKRGGRNRVVAAVACPPGASSLAQAQTAIER